METRDIVVDGKILGTITLPLGLSEEVWAQKMEAYLPTPDVQEAP